MEHAVHYRTAAGETRLEEVATLDAAVSMVERLRNDEGVSDVRVYRQVPIEFKTYYKVTVVDGVSPSASRPVASAPAPAAQPQADPTAPTSAPQSPPPGAMPLGPSTPSQPTAQPSAAVAGNATDEADQTKRGSLFSRG